MASVVFTSPICLAGLALNSELLGPTNDDAIDSFNASKQNINLIFASQYYLWFAHLTCIKQACANPRLV